MTPKQIAEEYNIPVSILDKMRLDSMSGSMYREYKQETSYNRYVKVVVRNGGEFEVSVLPMPKIYLKAETKGTEITQEKINNVVSELIKSKSK